LGTWNDAGNVGIFVGGSFVAAATPRAGFRTTCGFFFLFFCTSALALAFSPRQRIPSSHLALL